MLVDEIRLGESSTLELKKDTPSEDKKYLKTVVAFALCKSKGLKQPDIEERTESLTVTIWRQTTRLTANDRLSDRLKLSDTEQSIYNEIKIDGYIKTDEIEKNTGISIATISRVLKKLQENKYIERIGSKKTGRWQVLE